VEDDAPGSSRDVNGEVKGSEGSNGAAEEVGDSSELMLQLEALLRKDKAKRSKREDNSPGSSKKHRIERVQTVAG